MSLIRELQEKDLDEVIAIISITLRECVAPADEDHGFIMGHIKNDMDWWRYNREKCIALVHEILIAGGLRDIPDRPYVGGLWVLEVATRERAVALIEGDPYFVPDCRSYQLFSWGKAFADKAVVL